MLPGAEQHQSLRVLVVDDHPAIRAGLKAALDAEPDMSFIGEANDGFAAEEMAVRLNPDVILMDIFMPNRTGLEAIIAIKQKLPEVKILVLTVSEEEDDLFQAIRFGADGYLLKKSNLNDITHAVREIAAGQTSLSPELAVKVMRDINRARDKPELSEREQNVLKLLSGGLSSQEISEQLLISESTVNTYVHRLLRKLHLKNRGQAIAYSARHLSQK
ncbi:MAG: response regulator transcription factor [Chloroflexi bacterium]|nr:response regulator transcription factor [Chloroflexota bacterium]